MNYLIRFVAVVPVAHEVILPFNGDPVDLPKEFAETMALNGITDYKLVSYEETDKDPSYVPSENRKMYN